MGRKLDRLTRWDWLEGCAEIALDNPESCIKQEREYNAL
jgi:hypothetical protein